MNGTASGCHVCTKLSVNGKCVDECPSDLYGIISLKWTLQLQLFLIFSFRFVFRDTMRCITKQMCREKHGWIPFKGECRQKCPASYSHYHPVTKKYHPFECFECDIKCIERCPGYVVREPSDLEHFRECTIVDGSLYINLGSNIMDIYEKLEESLGNIETINGVLTIYR